MADTPEGYEKEKLKEYLKTLGAYEFWPVQTGYGRRTIDLLACVRGHFVGVEVKKEGYVPSDFTAAQILVMKQIREAGGVTFSGDGDEIIGWMQRWLASNR